MGHIVTLREESVTLFNTEEGKGTTFTMASVRDLQLLRVLD